MPMIRRLLRACAPIAVVIAFIGVGVALFWCGCRDDNHAPVLFVPRQG